MKKFLKQLKQNKKGFTLIEMIVVIAIIGILAAILVPSMSGYLSTARASKQEANARTIYTAAQAAVTSLETATTAVNGTYAKTSDATKAGTGKDLFDKIKDLVGETNYAKFSEIKVQVTNGGVDGISVTEKGTEEGKNGATTTYPKEFKFSS